MKHLISATLSPAAAAVWESWPTKNKANNEIGRSARLSELIESSADLRLDGILSNQPSAFSAP